MLEDIQLSSVEYETFDRFYEARLAESGGGHQDRQDLEIARDILLAAVNDGLTPTADGGFSHLRPGTTDWSDPATIEATQAATGQGSRRRVASGQSSRQDLLQGVGAFVLALAAIAWWFWPSSVGQAEALTTPTAPAEAGLAEASPTPLPTLEAELLADIVEGVRTELVVPRTLEIKGVSFVVQPVKITAGDWPFPADERAVSWVFGTVVNYVMGLEASPQNKELLASLELGDELLLRMSTGSTYRFAFLDALRIAPQASEVFRQTRPGLTLALVGDEGQAARVIVRATYLPDSELSAGPAAQRANIAEIGQPTALDTLKVTVQTVRPVAAQGSPPGHLYLAVEYKVENMGQDLPLMTGSFLHRLESGDGLTFPLAPGETGLPPLVGAGEQVAATATYVIPESALGNELFWRFASGASGPALRVKLPAYAGSLTALVSVGEVKQEPSGSLAISVTVQAALRQLHLTPADLMVEGATLDTAGTAFPWQVTAGQAGQFRRLVAPQTNPIRLGLLEQGFDSYIEESMMKQGHTCLREPP